mgnify:CR=1 FL=1
MVRVLSNPDIQLECSGGWHDAGDLSQQTLQTGDVAFALIEAAMSQKYDQALSSAMMEEARWGLEFLLNCRFFCFLCHSLFYCDCKFSHFLLLGKKLHLFLYLRVIGNMAEDYHSNET